MGLSKLLFGWTIKRGKPTEGEDNEGVIHLDGEERKIYVDGIEYAPNNDLIEDEEIANLHKRCDELETHVEGLNEQISKLDEDLSSVHSDMDTVEKDIEEMFQNKLVVPLKDSLTNGLDALAEQYRNLEHKISLMEEKDVEHSAYINNNTKEIDQLRERNNQLSAIVIKQQEALDKLNGVNTEDKSSEKQLLTD